MQNLIAVLLDTCISICACWQCLVGPIHEQHMHLWPYDGSLEYITQH